MISGTPVEHSSTELLMKRVADGYEAAFGPDEAEVEFIRLNDLRIKPCQACGTSPQPGYCFLNDSMSLLYEKLIDCDAILIGTPVYFDSVTAQTKLFIDRCNCLRPGDFSQGPEGNRFIRLLHKRRVGGMVIVGSERCYYEGARKVIAGFFKWVEVENKGMVSYASHDLRLRETVKEAPEALDEAFKLGQLLAEGLVQDA
jgi:multimeric flavodoxin WrbA